MWSREAESEVAEMYASGERPRRNATRAMVQRVAKRRRITVVADAGDEVIELLAPHGKRFVGEGTVLCCGDWNDALTRVHNALEDE